MQRLLTVLILVAGIVAATLLVGSETNHPDGLVGSRLLGGGEETSTRGGVEVLAVEQRAPYRTGVSNARQVETRTVKVIDELFAEPVTAAAMWCELTDVQIRREEAGSFKVNYPLGLGLDSLELKVRAPGYVQRNFSLGKASQATVSLRPDTMSTLALLYGGNASAAGVVEVSSVLPSGSAPPRSFVPDDSGIVTFGHAYPVHVTVRDGQGMCVFGRIVIPGEHIVVECRDGADIRLVDNEGKPLAGVGVMVRAVSGGGPGEYISDELGQLWARTGLGEPLKLELSTPEFRWAPVEEQVVGVTVSKSLQLPPMGPSGAQIDLIVRRTVQIFEVAEADTLEPVSGTAYIVRRHTTELGECLEMVLGQVRLDDGRLYVPYGKNAGTVRNQAVGDWLFLPGYRPYEVPRGVELFLPELSDAPTPFLLERVQSGAPLEVRDGARLIDLGVLALRDDATGLFCFVGGPGPEGRYGPIKSNGRVSACSIRGTPIGDAKYIGSEGVYQIQTAAQMGGIRVVFDIGGPANIVCCNVDSHLYTAPASGLSHSSTFEPLNPGRYVVGPQYVVEQLRASGSEALSALGVIVEAGKTTIIKADPDWSNGLAIDGRITWTKGGAPFLIKIHSLPLNGIPPAVATKRLHLGANGEYFIKPGGPKVLALVLAEYYGETLRVRAVIRPGGEYVLEEKSLLVEPPTQISEGEYYSISYDVGGTALEVGVGDMVRRTHLTLVGSAFPRQLVLPRSVEKIGVYRRSDGAMKVISLEGLDSSILHLNVLDE